MKLFGRKGSTFATVVAAAAVLAVTTTGGAVAGGLITSKQIKNNTIRSIDVHDGTLTGTDIADGSVGGADIADGSVGSADVADNSVTTNDVANGTLTHGDFTSSPVGLVQGYAWMDTATPGSSPVALSNSYLYNSAGGAITVSSSATGVYSLDFSGLSFYPGNVQVTAYGSAVTWCKVSSWGTSTVTVRCFDTAGTPTDSRFSLAVIK